LRKKDSWRGDSDVNSQGVKREIILKKKVRKREEGRSLGGEKEARQGWDMLPVKKGCGSTKKEGGGEKECARKHVVEKGKRVRPWER